MIPPSESRLSRRAVLGAFAGAGTLLAAPTALAADASSKPRATLRDRLWIFTVPAGCDDNWYEKGGIHGGSRMTPAEGALDRKSTL